LKSSYISPKIPAREKSMPQKANSKSKGQTSKTSKDDLVTKSYLHTELKKLDKKIDAVKDDVEVLKSDVGTLKVEMMFVKTDLGGLRSEFTDFKDKVLTILDRIALNTEDRKIEDAAVKYSLGEVEKKVEDNEVRIQALEAKKQG